MHSKKEARKLPVFADALYIENFKDSTKILALINKFSQVAKYKISIQKSVLCFCKLMNYQKDKLIILVTAALKTKGTFGAVSCIREKGWFYLLGGNLSEGQRNAWSSDGGGEVWREGVKARRQWSGGVSVPDSRVSGKTGGDGHEKGLGWLQMLSLG